MSAESTLRTEQDGGAAASVAAASMTGADASHPTVPLFGTSSDGAPSAREQQLIAQMQVMQLQIDELKRQVQELTALPSAGAFASVASSSAHAVALCARQQKPSSPHPTQSSSAPRLHKDALHCVLACLSLTELPSAMRSCRAWYAAVRSLPLQNVSLPISARQLYQLPLSAFTPLARHIVTCDVRDAYTVEDLAQFLAFLPCLQSLSHWACLSSKPHPQLYSSQLRELNVDLYIEGRDDGGDGGTDALLMQMENLRSVSGLRSLTLRLPFNVDGIEPFSLEPIECILALESLTLHNGYRLPTAQMVYIRRLPSLRALSLGGWSEWHVEALLEAQPGCPPLHLHFFGGLDREYLDLKKAQLLVRLTTLQRVEPRSITADALQILAYGLPDLHTLTVGIRPREVDGSLIYDWPLVRASLTACRQLTALTLESTPLEDLAALFLALPPSLRKLDIRHCDGFLQSDAFFQCVSEGGFRKLERLQVRPPLNGFDQQQVAAWQQRQLGCAPWIQAVIED
jgi:hypothetical protein